VNFETSLLTNSSATLGITNVNVLRSEFVPHSTNTMLTTSSLSTTLCPSLINPYTSRPDQTQTLTSNNPN
jgi:hypothetical protein